MRNILLSIFMLTLFSLQMYGQEALKDIKNELSLNRAVLPYDIDSCDLDCCYGFDIVDQACSTLAIRHIEAKGVGYCQGYTTFEGLIFPFCSSCDIWPYFDFRAHVFNNSDFAGNIGIGSRYFNPCSGIVYGINLYFDFRRSNCYHHFFPQISAGFERLSPCWDVRMNVYVPLNEKKLIENCFFEYKGGHFIHQKKYQAALIGFDAELGKYLFEDHFKIYGAIGPYIYRGIDCIDSFLGVRGRLSFYLNRYITIDGFITYDNNFDLNIQGSIGIQFPFNCCPKSGYWQDLLSQHIQKNEIIVLDKYCTWKYNY